MELISNIEWLDKLLDLIPEPVKTRKNLISIAGYPHWETVNSNLLAFYLDAKEEHNFSRLFIDSLLELIEAKTSMPAFSREIYDTEFVVDREVSTHSGGRIDILIKESFENEDDSKEPESGWAVIIENKVYANLYNNLSDYWNSVKAEKKILVVLSLNVISDSFKNLHKNIVGVNVTHKELIDRVKKNLADCYLDSDDRHLLFLKEYIANCTSLYKDKKDTMEMDKTLQLFHSNKEEIEKFKKTDMELLKYISNSVFDVMREMGFPPNSTKDSSKSKHFQVDQANTDALSDLLKSKLEIAKKFRFWIDISHLRYNSVFIAYFELWGRSNTKYGDELKAKLIEKQIFTEQVQLGTGGKSLGEYQHIYSIKIPVELPITETFKSQLSKALTTYFFKHKNQFIETAVNELDKIIIAEQKV